MEDPQPIDSNTVQIRGSMINDIQYVDGTFQITQGQLYQLPPTIVQSGSEWNITVLANRHNSSPVANDFNIATGGSGHEYAGWTFEDTSPAELNFYFGVDLTFGSETVPVHLGQGHTGFNNNWWIGGSAVEIDGRFARLVVGDSQFYLQGGVSWFELSTNPPQSPC